MATISATAKAAAGREIAQGFRVLQAVRCRLAAANADCGPAHASNRHSECTAQIEEAELCGPRLVPQQQEFVPGACEERIGRGPGAGCDSAPEELPTGGLEGLSLSQQERVLGEAVALLHE